MKSVTSSAGYRRPRSRTGGVIKKHLKGFSLIEVIVMIAVVGILSSVAIGTYGNITKASKEAVAQNLVETLNNATKDFGHAQYRIISNGENSESTDEVQILQTLQWKDTEIEFGVAGPFMRTDWVPATSNSTDDYRAIWSGSFWKLARPGEAGAGLEIDFDAADLGQPSSLPDDFQPVKFVLDEPVDEDDTDPLPE